MHPRSQRPTKRTIRLGLGVATLSILLAGPAMAGVIPTPATEADLVDVLVHGWDPADTEAAAERSGLTVLERWDRVDIVAARGPLTGLDRLAADPRVKRVEVPSPIIRLGTPTGSATGRLPEEPDDGTSGDALAYDVSELRASRVDEVTDPGGPFDDAGGPFDGSGITIATVDSGVDADHPMLRRGEGSKVRRDLVFDACVGTVECDRWIEAPPGHDGDGHGTMVASVAVGNRSWVDGVAVGGTAPGADVVSLGASETDPFGHLSALHWILVHHDDPCGDGSCAPIRVVSNSWGSATNDHDPSSAGAVLTRALVAEGITVIYAAANNGDGHPDLNGRTVNALGQTETPGVLLVGNYDDNDAGFRDHRLSSDSSQGDPRIPVSWPDLAAPGSSVWSGCNAVGAGMWGSICIARGPYLTRARHTSWSGTSVSAPHLAGIVALMLAADPTLTPAAVEDVLEDTAHWFGPDDGRFDVTNRDHPTSRDHGHGLVDAASAVARVLDRPAPPARPCRHEGGNVEGRWDNNALGGWPSQWFADGPAGGGAAHDVVAGRISSDADALTMTTWVTALDDGDTTSGGWVFETLGSTWMVRLSQTGGAPPSAQLFSGLEIVAQDLEATVDTDANTLSVRVPLDSWNRFDPTLPILGPGHQLLLTNTFLSSDNIDGGCPHVIGTGS